MNCKYYKRSLIQKKNVSSGKLNQIINAKSTNSTRVVQYELPKNTKKITNHMKNTQRAFFK